MVLEGLTRRLQRTNKDQYTVTIPKTLVGLLELREQDELLFGLDGNIITLQKRAGRILRRGLTRKLQRTNKDQYTITIPKSLVGLVRLQEQEELMFGLDKGTITLKKRREGGKHE